MHCPSGSSGLAIPDEYVLPVLPVGAFSSRPACAPGRPVPPVVPDGAFLPDRLVLPDGPVPPVVPDGCVLPVLPVLTGRTGKPYPSGTTGGTGPSRSTRRSGRKAPSERTGRTGRTYPSGIASPSGSSGLCIAASGGDAQSSFAIVAFHRVFKQLVVRNFCIVNQVGFFGNTHIEPPLPTESGTPGTCSMMMKAKPKA